MGDGILCQDGDVVGINHIRNAVMDLRIDVIGAACEYNSAVPCLFHPFQGFFALPFDVFTHPGHFIPARAAGHADLIFGDLRKDLYQLVGQNSFAGQRQEWRCV